MKEALSSLRKQFQEEVGLANSLEQIDSLRIKYLGKKSPLQKLLKSLGSLTKEDRPLMGKYINDLKQEIVLGIDAKRNLFIEKEEKEQFAKEKLDVTLPGQRRHSGAKHIITQVLDEILDIMIHLGFSVQLGPDIDTEYYNFESLNFPKDHPAKDMQDTFYISPEKLLRTHTSNVQTRIMESTTPPIRICSPGRCFRNETITARSHVFFHHVEAVYVDKNVSMADLFATLDEFLEKFFGKEIKTRYRPSYFPFVEPGLEVDVSCFHCKGIGCYICKKTGWLEVAGAGMIHPEVLRFGGIDAEEYTGFAWGFGSERAAMLKYGITDIRLFTENDLRFLSQFVSL